jgi:hypothetical protein
MTHEMSIDQARSVIRAMLIVRDEGQQRGGDVEVVAANICHDIILFFQSIDPDDALFSATFVAETAKRPPRRTA